MLTDRFTHRFDDLKEPLGTPHVLLSALKTRTPPISVDAEPPMAPHRPAKRLTKRQAAQPSKPAQSAKVTQ